MRFGGRCSVLTPELDYDGRDPSVEEWKQAIIDRHEREQRVVRGQDGEGNPVRMDVDGSADYWLDDSDKPGLPEDPVTHPSHYTHLPVECIDVTEHFGFLLGNVIKYVWRADFKGKPLEDLKKARFYLDREIAKRERLGG